ncbi:MAG TPA: OmpA family protein [Polyangiales bacterium]|nr:OmpA family protein [Polyangiales bacterium]
MDRLSASCAAACLLVGCVSQAKYDDLKAQYDHAQAELGERQQRIGTLGASVQDLKGENARARTQLEALEQEYAQLQAEQRSLTVEMTKALEERARLKQSGEQLRVALGELAARKAEADRRVAEFRDLLNRFKNLIDAGTLKVTISDGRMVLQLPTDVLFDSGSARLSKPGKAAIDQVTAVLEEVSDRRYQIEGHTDNVPIHNAQYRSNWELAAARGLGVLRAMNEAGMDARLLSAASYGEFHPIASNDSEQGRAANRRIEVILVPDLSRLPGYEELQQLVQAP